MVGDRLDTDIEGAHHADVASLLVLTGVTGLAELVSARPEQRPTYLSGGLTGLLHPHAAPERVDRGAGCGGWRAVVRDGGSACRAPVLPTTGGARPPSPPGGTWTGRRAGRRRWADPPDSLDA